MSKHESPAQRTRRLAKLKAREGEQRNRRSAVFDPVAFEKRWDVPCENCGAVPTVGTTTLCGLCCFGEADTADGNW